MYLWMRNTHLWLGTLGSLFLLVYGVSAVQMGHNRWFRPAPTVSEREVTLPAEAMASPRAAARALMDGHGLRGEIAQVVDGAASVSFRIVRPGTVAEVKVDRASRKARVRTSVAPFMGMLNRIHHVAGVHHEYALLNLWGVLVAVVSLSLILIGATGIYLWFKLHAERRTGAVLLALSLGYSVPLVVWLRILS